METRDILIALIMFSLGFILGGVFVVKQGIHPMNARACQRGFAEYSTDAGTFKWINKDVQFVVDGD